MVVEMFSSPVAPKLLATAGVGLTNFAIALYLLWVYRHQRVRNPSTRMWMLGFFIWGSVQLLRYAIQGRFLPSIDAVQGLTVSGYLNVIAYVLMLWGIALVIFHRRFVRAVLPLVIGTVATLGLVSSLLFIHDVPLLLKLWTFGALAPLSFLVAVCFFLLYGVLVAEDAGRNLGALILGIGFLFNTVQLLYLPATFASRGELIWILIRIIAQLTILTGLILLERELRTAIEDLLADRKHAVHLHATGGKELR